MLSYPVLGSVVKKVTLRVFHDTDMSPWSTHSCLGWVTFPECIMHHFFFWYSFKCTVSNYNSEPAFTASSLCQKLSSAHDRIAKNLCYIIIYATQIRSANMNSLAVTFVNNSLVNLWMTNTRSWKPTKTLVGGREITSKKTQKGTENSSIFQVKLSCKFLDTRCSLWWQRSLFCPAEHLVTEGCWGSSYSYAEGRRWCSTWRQ